MKKVSLALLAIVMLLIAACSASKVERGIARDTIFSVEKTKKGTYGIFLTHDESVVYCTPNEELGLEALSLLQEHTGEVVLEFKSKKDFKDVEGEIFGADQCQRYCDSSGDCFETMILLDVVAAPSR